MAETDGKELAAQSGVPAALALFAPQGQSLLADVREALGGEDLNLTTLTELKTPAAAGKYWDTPQGPRETIEGVIVLRHATRAYYATSYEEAPNTPPDCFSPDMLVGIGNPGGDCTKCPFAEFGSAKNNAMACAQQTNLFIVTPDSGVLPWYYKLSPTNFQTFKDYGVIQASLGKPYHQVISRLSLEQTKSNNGTPYSRVKVEMVRALTPEESAAMVKYREDFAGMFAAMVTRPPRQNDDANAVESTARA